MDMPYIPPTKEVDLTGSCPHCGKRYLEKSKLPPLGEPRCDGGRCTEGARNFIERMIAILREGK